MDTAGADTHGGFVGPGKLEGLEGLIEPAVQAV